MASTGPQHPSMGGFVSGCDPHFNALQQQQAQSQAQIEFLRQQNLLLNQQLATQAQTHIQHLQQTMPAHPQPASSVASPTIPQPPPPSTSHPPPCASTAAPSAAAPQPAPTSTPPPNTDELFKKMSADLKEDIASSLRDLREQPRQDADLREVRERQRQDTSKPASPRHVPEPSHPPPPATPAAVPPQATVQFTSTSSATFTSWNPSTKSMFHFHIQASRFQHPLSHAFRAQEALLCFPLLILHVNAMGLLPDHAIGLLPDHVALLGMPGPGQNVLTNGPSEPQSSTSSQLSLPPS